MRGASHSRGSLATPQVYGSQENFSTNMNSSPMHDQKSSFNLNQCKRPSASYSAPFRNSTYLPPNKDWDQNKKDINFHTSTGIWLTIKKLSHTIEDSRWLNAKFMRNNRSELIGWFMLVIFIFVGYKFFSDGSFSAILTLSSWFQCFSIFLLNLKAISQNSTNGVSQRSVALIILCLICRLSSTLFFNGYLPVDRSGDWLYQGGDIVSSIFGITLLIYSRRRCKASIQAQQENDTCYVLIPLVVALLLAMLVHPTLNRSFIFDTAWTFALYLETYSMVPQLFMMGKLGGEIEALTSHYVASMATSKIFCVLFWYFSYSELTPVNGGYNIAGWVVMISYTIQALLFVDFLYYYVRSLRIGRRMIIYV